MVLLKKVNCPMEDQLEKNLKPCPFCGSKKIEFSNNRCCLYCDECESEGPVSYLMNYDDVKKDAVKLWNERCNS